MVLSTNRRYFFAEYQYLSFINLKLSPIWWTSWEFPFYSKYIQDFSEFPRSLTCRSSWTNNFRGSMSRSRMKSSSRYTSASRQWCHSWQLFCWNWGILWWVFGVYVCHSRICTFWEWTKEILWPHSQQLYLPYSEAFYPLAHRFDLAK